MTRFLFCLLLASCGGGDPLPDPAPDERATTQPAACGQLREKCV